MGPLEEQLLSIEPFFQTHILLLKCIVLEIGKCQRTWIPVDSQRVSDDSAVRVFAALAQDPGWFLAPQYS